MATEVAQEAAAGSGSTGNPDPRGKGLLASGKFRMALLLLLVILSEAVVLYLWLPGPSADVESDPAQAEGSALPGRDAPGDTVEVPIGTTPFVCTNSKASLGSVIHVTFRLYAIVSRDKAAEFTAGYEMYKARMQQAIITVARSSNREDLDDPNLSTMRRLMKEKINKVLQKSDVLEVVISEYKTMEQ